MKTNTKLTHRAICKSGRRLLPARSARLAFCSAMLGLSASGLRGQSAQPGVMPQSMPNAMPDVLPSAAPAAMPDAIATSGPPVAAPAEPAQARPNIYTPNRVGDFSNQAPVDALIVRVPQATTLNSNAGSTEYADRHRNAFTLQAETSGTYTSNLYNNFSQTGGAKGGAYLDFAFPVGYQHVSAETAYNVYFRGTVAAYPSHTSLNHNSEIFAGEYVHNSSERTTWTWSVAGGRVQTVEGYLPAVVAVGTTGVVQSNFTQGLKPVYNAATTMAVTHQLTERDTVVVAATGAFMQQPYSQATQTTRAVLYRSQTGGLDVELLHALNPKRALGIEGTEVYIHGASPLGHSNYNALQATYRQVFSREWSIHIAGGPLFSENQAPGASSRLTSSYIASGAVDYQTNYAHIAGGYSRVLQLGYLAAASPANQYFLLFDRPITRTLNLTVDARDVRDSAGTKAVGGYSNFGLSTRLSLQATARLVFFLGGQFFTQSQTGASISRNDATVGMVYTFGMGLARTGAR